MRRPVLSLAHASSRLLSVAALAGVLTAGQFAVPSAIGALGAPGAAACTADQAEENAAARQIKGGHTAEPNALTDAQAKAMDADLSAKVTQLRKSAQGQQLLAGGSLAATTIRSTSTWCTAAPPASSPRPTSASR